jgi:hypothetical protein
LHYREGDVVDPGSVFSGVGAESFERLIDSNLSLGSEHAFGLLNNEPGIQRLLQAFLRWSSNALTAGVRLMGVRAAGRKTTS